MFIVFVIVADNLDTGGIGRRDVATQYIEMPAEGFVWYQVHAGLDYRIAITLRAQTALDGMQNFVVGQRERGHIMPAQVTKRNRFQFFAACRYTGLKLTYISLPLCVIQARIKFNQPSHV